MADVDLIEEWRTIEAHPDYEVSNLGRVRRATDSYYPNSKRKRTYAGRILKPTADKDGRVSFGHLGRVAPFVCTAFHGPKPSPKHEVAHWDGNPQNNVFTNLRWATHKENGEDMTRHGNQPRGEHRKCAKLSAAIALEVRALLARGFTQQAVADKYGVARTSIQCINDGRSYGWLRPDQEPRGL